MKKSDTEAQYMRLKDSLNQVMDSIFKIEPTAVYVRRLLMQEQTGAKNADGGIEGIPES